MGDNYDVWGEIAYPIQNVKMVQRLKFQTDM